MAYYDALIAAWNAGGVPSGASGTAIVGGMTTDQKMAAVNSWTVSGPTNLVVVSTYKIFNAMDPTEFAALTTAQQTRVRDILSMGTVDGSAGTHVNAVLTAVFGAGTNTRANLVALANTFKTTVPWWRANGYGRQFDTGDIAAAGVS